MSKYRIEATQVPGIAEMLYFRQNTTDYNTLEYVFINKEYRLRKLNYKPKWIIDAGANVGYTGVYFANKYPEANIIAIEPDDANFEILKMNVKPYKKINVMQSGLWNKETYLKVKDVGLGEWGMVVEETNMGGPNTLKATTISSVMKEHKIDEIDILKINIEGAEKELFTYGYEEWLSKVKILIIELHDNINPGCSEVFFKAVEPFNFKYKRRGYNHILYKKGCL